MLSAPSGQAVVHAPQRVHIAYDGSASVLMSPGTSIPVLVTTLIASVGHILAHAPIWSHFSSSQTIPSSDAGFAGPNSTSSSIASTGHSCSQRPHAVQISGSSTDNVDDLGDNKVTRTCFNTDVTSNTGVFVYFKLKHFFGTFFWFLA